MTNTVCWYKILICSMNGGAILEKIKKQASNFVVGAFVIAVAHILAKFIGALYKIPLDTYILGPKGMGVYSQAYIIYSWLFVVSTAGLPVAISKMVSEAIANDDFTEGERIFKISRKLLLVVGIIAFLILFFGAGLLSKINSSGTSETALMFMAPSLFFVCLSSSYRGYYQGRENMMPTAVSEVIEAFCKLVFGLLFAYYAIKIYKVYYIGAAGAILGVTVGTFFSMIFLMIYHGKKREKNLVYTPCDAKKSKEILTKLIKLAIPITLGVSVFTLTSVIDAATVLRQLEGIGFMEAKRDELFGYLNRAITLFNFPPTIISAIAISIVPAIASNIALKDNKKAILNVKTALKVTILIAMPCAVGLSALASPILELVYSDPNHSFLLNVMGISVLFVTVVQVSNAILQAYNRPWVPVVNMLIGGIVKIGVNYVLVSRPEININGAPIGTLLCYITVMSLNLYQIKKITGLKFGIKDFIIKPLSLGIVTAAVAIYSYSFISSLCGNFISTLGAISIAAIIYVIFFLLIKALNRYDLSMLPKGDKITKVLERFKLI